MRQLLSRGLTPVCLVRSPEKLFRQHPEVSAERLAPMTGTLDDVGPLREAAGSCQAVIHLVGIIQERRLLGQTFRRVHVQGTRNVVDAAVAAGVKRFVHMSALGTRPNAKARYHRTKWEAEEYVRKSGLEWTIFRPSLIHGPQGEFMQLMKRFAAAVIPPVMPYFGSGRAKIQPVSVKDVAFCLVESLYRPETILKVYELGGPRVYTWVELYNAVRAHMPGAKRWKPIVSQPVPLAKAVAVATAPVMAVAECVIPPIGLFRFNVGQVDMAQEDNVCDQTVAEAAFGIKMRDFEEELAGYADQIR